MILIAIIGLCSPQTFARNIYFTSTSQVSSGQKCNNLKTVHSDRSEHGLTVKQKTWAKRSGKFFSEKYALKYHFTQSEGKFKVVHSSSYLKIGVVISRPSNVFSIQMPYLVKNMRKMIDLLLFDKKYIFKIAFCPMSTLHELLRKTLQYTCMSGVVTLAYFTCKQHVLVENLFWLSDSWHQQEPMTLNVSPNSVQTMPRTCKKNTMEEATIESKIGLTHKRNTIMQANEIIGLMIIKKLKADAFISCDCDQKKARALPWIKWIYSKQKCKV